MSAGFVSHGFVAGGTTSRHWLSWLLTAAVAGAVLGSPAFAGPIEVGGFVGDQPGTSGGVFIQPTDVAFYAGSSELGLDDKLFVVEGSNANARVQRLDSNGNFERAWGKDVVRPGSPGDTGTGYEICTQARHCKAGVRSDAGGALRKPSALAVDPSNGNVYVLDGGNRRVSRYTPEGRYIRSWRLAPAADGYGNAAVAVAPTPPHDVFVADEPHDRVLQFDRGGDFLMAWGRGVASGGPRFEVCVTERLCRTGRPIVVDGRRTPSWPSQIAVDRQGTVYGSAFFGYIFDGPQTRTRIIRFRSVPAPPGRVAEHARLPPLTPRTGGPPTPSNESAHLTNGTTLGIDVRPADGDLIAINNPFGKSELDVISGPGSKRPSKRALDTLPFLQNVSGVAVGGHVIYLSSGVLRQRTGSSTFTGCTPNNVPRDCHGLIVLARSGHMGAVPAPPLAEAAGRLAPTALVYPHGAARYQFQVSRDGREWRKLGDRRYVVGGGGQLVAAQDGQLRAGVLYRVRLMLSKKTRHGGQDRISDTGVFRVPDDGG